VTGTIVEAGPTTVRGPNHADSEWVSAAIDGIDDELTLVGDRPVDVDEVWRTVIRDVTGGRGDTLVVVCPTWWSSARMARVRDAASAVARDVVMLRRAEVPRVGRTVLVETAPDCVVFSTPAGGVEVFRRGDIAALVASIPTSTAVVVDGHEGIEGAGLLADRLRANGVDVTVADPEWVRRSIEEARTHDEAEVPDARPSTKRGARVAILAGTLLSAAALCGGFVARHDEQPSAPDTPMTLLVEGRVGVMVPARWAIQRVTSGPGSARVQIVSLDDKNVAVHVTQSSLAPRQSREQVAEALRRALRQEPDGVFVDFNPSDSRADQLVMTYREIRADRQIQWSVLIDGPLRIAVGCQSAPGHEEAVREVCDRAIRSAHAVF
jgi:type VII secretion-associated protein (TIGR03931 family)